MNQSLILSRIKEGIRRRAEQRRLMRNHRRMLRRLRLGKLGADARAQRAKARATARTQGPEPRSGEDQPGRR